MALAWQKDAETIILLGEKIDPLYTFPMQTYSEMKEFSGWLVLEQQL